MLFLLNLMLTSWSAYSQHLIGRYTSPLEHGNRTIKFEGDRFTDETKDGSYRIYGYGTYKANDSLLQLTYEKIKNSASLNYIFDEQIENNDVTRVSLQLNYEDGTAAQALIAIFDCDHKRLITYSTDKMGQSSFIIDHQYDSMILSITGIPYELVKIPIKRLKNRYTKIKAVLKEKRLTFLRPGKISYNMEKTERGDLILKSNEYNDGQLWRKVN